MKLVNVEPKENYILRVYLDDLSVIDFNVAAELERIPSYKPLYDVTLFRCVRFKNKRIFWDDRFDFHLDQILTHGEFVHLPSASGIGGLQAQSRLTDTAK